MFVFSKVLDQLICATLLKITLAKIHQGVCLDFRRNYLPDNIIMTFSVYLKPFCSTTSKCRIFSVWPYTGNESVSGNTWNVKTSRFVKCRFPLIYLQLLKFHSSFVRKNVFYSKNIQYAEYKYTFCGTELYVNICRGVFRTQSNIYGEASFKTSKKEHYCRCSDGSKYASGIGVTVEKAYRISIFIWYSQSRLQKFALTSFFLI